MTYWQGNLYLACGDSGIFWDTEYFIETGLLKNLWLWTPRDPCCVLNPTYDVLVHPNPSLSKIPPDQKESSRAWPSACANIHDHDPCFLFQKTGN